MRPKSIFLTCAALLAIAIPAAASADPWDHDGWRDHEWRGHEWRENAWREHEWREHEAWAHRDRWGWYGPRCVIEDRGHYDWYGNFIHEPVRICWR